MEYFTQEKVGYITLGDSIKRSGFLKNITSKIFHCYLKYFLTYILSIKKKRRHMDTYKPTYINLLLIANILKRCTKLMTC